MKVDFTVVIVVLVLVVVVGVVIDSPDVIFCG